MPEYILFIFNHKFKKKKFLLKIKKLISTKKTNEIEFKISIVII